MPRPLCVALLISACVFRDEVPPGQVTRCAADRDCPSAQQCDVALRRCVRPATGVLLGASLEPALGKAGTVFRARLEPGPDFVGDASLSLWTADGTRVASFARDAADALSFSWTATGAEPEGTLAVLLDARATSGTVAGLRAGTLRLDFTAPSPALADLRLFPGPDNALANLGFASSLAAVTVGSSIQVSLTASEPLQALPPGRVVCDGGGAVDFPLTTSGTLERPQLRGALRTAPARDGPCAVEVDLTDAVGNQATRTLGFVQPLVLDVTAPPAPPVDGEREVLFVRAPTGESPDGGPAFRVELTKPPAEPSVLVVSNLDGVVLARVVSFDAAPPVARLGVTSDPVDVDVQWVDLAGNASPRVRVHDHDFLALLAPRRGAGGLDVFTTPATRVRTGLEDIVEVTAHPGSLAVSLVDGGMAELSLDDNFPVPMLTELGRAARPGAAAGGDIFGGRVYFGGTAPSGAVLRELLMVDPSLATTLSVQANGPVARTEATLVSLGQGTLLFGGRGADGGLLEDTWLLGRDGGWAEVDGGPQRPPARVRAGMLASTFSTAVLAGGRGADGGLLGDGWRYGPAGWSPLPFPVPPREKPTLVSGLNGLLLFGGRGADGGLARELFVLDGGAQLVSVAPEGREGASCFDNSSFLTCAGGVGALGADGGYSSLLWQRSTNTWSAFSAPASSRTYGAQAAVPVPGGVLFTGLLVGCDDLCDGPGAYRWNGRVLRRVPETSGFGLASSSGMAATPNGPEWLGTFFPSRPTHLRWTPTGSVVLDLLPPSVDLAREGAGFGYDSTRGLYVYGGGVLRGGPSYTPLTSTFVGPSGAALAPGPALPDAGLFVAVDRPDLGGLVFYGSSVSARFAGTQWVLGAAPARPACVAYDSLRAELYVSDGNPQTRLTRADGGVVLIDGLSCPLGYDPARARVSSYAESTITEVDSSGARPRLALALDARAAAPGDAGVKRVTLELLAGGDGVASGQPVSGARARVAFGPSPANAAGTSAPAPLTFEVTAVDDDGGFRATGRLAVQVEPVGSNGAGEAAVVVSGRTITWLKR